MMAAFLLGVFFIDCHVLNRTRPIRNTKPCLCILYQFSPDVRCSLITPNVTYFLTFYFRFGLAVAILIYLAKSRTVLNLHLVFHVFNYAKVFVVKNYGKYVRSNIIGPKSTISCSLSLDQRQSTVVFDWTIGLSVKLLAL